MKKNIKRGVVAREALSWAGTPYHHQQTKKGVGCDCLGLLRGVYRAFVGSEPVPVPNYSPDWGESGQYEHMLAVCRSHLVSLVCHNQPVRQVASIPLNSSHKFKKGQVLIFRMRRGAIAKHCGIVTRVKKGNISFIHAQNGRGVIETELSKLWHSKITAVFDFPGVC